MGEHGQISSLRSGLSQSRRLQPPWNEKRVLLLNGDASSGLACLFILRKLVEDIIIFEKKENPRINNSKTSPLMGYFDNVEDDFRLHHYFDYISGISTGGIAAILLGHGRMTIDDTIDHVRSIWEFQRPGLVKSFLFDARTGNAREVHSRLHEYIETRSIIDLLRNCSSASEACMDAGLRFRAIPGMCQTLVFAAKRNSPNKGHVFRSYPPTQDKENSKGSIEDTDPYVSVVNICRALIADRTEFKEVKISNTEGYFYDASTENVEPSSLIKEELRTNHPESGLAQTFLEIGNHTRKNPSTWTYTWPFQNPAPISKQPEPCAKDINYFHFTGPIGTNGLKMDHIRLMAETYCSSPSIKAQLEEWAKKLVALRRARAQTMEWQNFALPVRYSCSLCRSQRNRLQMMDRPAFFDHVEAVHDFYSLPPSEMFRVQEESRVDV